MLDSFYATHTLVVFSNARRISLGDKAFADAMTLAERRINPPSREMLQNGAPFQRHEGLYSFLVEEELYLAGITPVWYLEKILCETVILQKLFDEESELERTPSVGRSVAVLGCMIQGRMTRLLTELDTENIEAILGLPDRVSSLNRSRWVSSVIGASAEAKALIELGRITNLRIFNATLGDDMRNGIDLFVEMRSGQGACVSVKSRAMQPDYLCLTPPMYEDLKLDWDRIEEGTRRFNETYRREWHPALLQIGRGRDRTVDLTTHKPRLFRSLKHALANNEFISVFAL